MLVSIYFLLKGQLKWNLDGVTPSAQPSAFLIIGCTMLLLYLLYQWRGIVNTMKVEGMSLSTVEKNHPYLPQSTEMIMTVLLTLIALILGTQFIMQASAFGDCDVCDFYSSGISFSSSSSSSYQGTSSSYPDSSSSSSSAGYTSSSSSSSSDGATSGGTGGGDTAGQGSGGGITGSASGLPNASSASPVAAVATLTIHVFQDLNNDGVQQTFEPDVPRAEGTVTYGASSDTTVDATIVTNAAGKASIITMPVSVSAFYSVTMHAATIGQDWVTEAVSGTAAKSSNKTILIPLRLRLLIGTYDPCIHLEAHVLPDTITDASGAERMLALLTRDDGAAITGLTRTNILATRGEFLALLQSLTVCKPLSDPALADSLSDMRQGTYQSGIFSDLRPTRMKSDAVTRAFFEAFARHIPDTQIPSPQGKVANAEGTLTWGNAVHWIYALVTNGTAPSTQVPDDTQLAALQAAGVIPSWLTVAQFSKTVPTAQALKTALLAMYSAGSLDLTQPSAADESRTSALQPFIEKMGPLPFMTSAANRTVRSTRFFPDNALYAAFARVAATASNTKDGSLYTLGNFTANGGTVYTETRHPDDPVRYAEFLRAAALLLGNPSPQSRNDALGRIQQTNGRGAGAYTQVVGFVIDIFGLPRSAGLTVAGRIAASAQTVGTDLLSLFSFSASDIQEHQTLVAASPVTRDHFARLIASLVTVNSIRNNTLSASLGNEQSSQIYQAVFVMLTGKKTADWGKDLPAVMNAPVTFGEYIRIIDAVTQHATAHTSGILPLLWLTVIR